MDVFQGLTSNSVPLLYIMGKSKEIRQDFQTPEGTTFIFTNNISINTMGPRSRHTAQEGDAFCLLEMNVLWCEN